MDSVRGNVLTADDQPSTLVLSEKAQIEGEIRVSHAVDQRYGHRARARIRSMSNCSPSPMSQEMCTIARWRSSLGRWCRAVWSTRTEDKTHKVVSLKGSGGD